MNVDIFNAILTSTINDLVNEPQTFVRKVSSRHAQSFDSSSRNKNSRPLYHSEERKIIDSGEAARKFLSTRAPIIVNDVIKRLELSRSKAHGKFLDGKSLDDLTAEKAKVKAELIFYDTSFYKFVGRFPSEKEREQMKRCYLYYNKLKYYIAKYPERTKKTDDIFSEELTELKNEYSKLNSRKEELQKFLLSYENDFSQKYGRKIQYQKDLQPISREYGEYKELKEKISKVKEKLKIKGEF